MRRRSWLALGGLSAATLVLGGGTLAWVEPGVRDARLAPSARTVFRAIAGAVLEGTLPVDPSARGPALDALLERIDGLVANLPAHAQSELSQLLALLASAPGRTLLAGLQPGWDEASVTDVQRALQGMRLSTLPLRRQAYQALHDIVGGAYFADPSTWSVLGYPGPLKV